MSGSLDLGLTWLEAGGDSLGLMRLSLALEKSLGRKLTFDQLDPDMTATQLAQVLVQQTIAVPESNTARLHLISGMFGDNPAFGDFRRSLVGVRTALVELPDLSCPSRVLRDIGETAAEVAKEIERQQPEGAILLGGYSFGGLVAYAVAQRLAASGREIALLALLDPYVPHRKAKSDTLARRLKRALSVLATPVIDWDAARRWLLDAFARRWPRHLSKLRVRIEVHLRLRAIKRWRPTPLKVPMLLAISEELAAFPTWLRAARSAKVVFVPGVHTEIFKPPALSIVRDALLERLHLTVPRAAEAPASRRPAGPEAV
jgi:thioesterase domain-containing protein